jgi:hypothetical protein
MAASFTIAARNNGFTPAEAWSVTAASLTSYRKAMADFAAMRTMDIWYSRLAEKELMKGVARAAADATRTKGQAHQARKAVKRAKASQEKAHTRDSLQALSKLGEMTADGYRIVSQPPIVVPARDLAEIYGISSDQLQDVIYKQFREYRATLQADRRLLLERFEIVDMARKVVGVGSVGTRAWIILFVGRDDHDPLILQMKEAQASVLEPFLGKSHFSNHGQRVVEGQRLMQAASDMMLGWIRTSGIDGVERDFYIRQLWDSKASALVDAMEPASMLLYAKVCGQTSARAHARSGDAVAISSYLGTSDAFDRALAVFAEAYADQNERDYAALKEAAESGRIPVQTGV